jgi:hypothetical protein
MPWRSVGAELMLASYQLGYSLARICAGAGALFVADAFGWAPAYGSGVARLHLRGGERAAERDQHQERHGAVGGRPAEASAPAPARCSSPTPSAGRPPTAPWRS